MTKDKFLRAYANLPSKVRDEIIVVVDKKPYTWNAAFAEISNDTAIGKNIIERLVGMGLI